MKQKRVICPHCGCEIGEPDRVRYKKHQDRWNELARQFGFRGIERMTEVRRQHLRCRLIEYPDLWDRVARAFSELDSFALGARWLTFDWVTKATNLQKLLEGNYAKRSYTDQPAANVFNFDNEMDMWARKQGLYA